MILLNTRSRQAFTVQVHPFLWLTAGHGMVSYRIGISAMSILETKEPLVSIPEPFDKSRFSEPPLRLINAAWRRSIVCGLLIATDISVFTVSVTVAQKLSHTPIADVPDSIAFLSIPAIIAFYGILGLYAEWGLSPVERLRLRVLGILAYLVTGMIVIGVSEPHSGSTVFFILTALFLFVLGHYAEFFARRFLDVHGVWGVPTVVIGSSGVQELAAALLEQPDFGLRPVGIISEPINQSQLVESPRLPVLGTLKDADQLARKYDVALVLKSQLHSTEELMQLPFKNVILISDSASGRGISVRSRTNGDAIGHDIQSRIFRHQNLRLKRAIDLIASIPLAILALPLLLVLVAIIKIIDPGPGLFWQERVGQHGRTIRVCKLRTMYVDAEQRLQALLSHSPEARDEWKSHFKLSKDPRILPFAGQFIRRASLDELPQILNILQGDMSLVGPRPFPEYHLKSFDDRFQQLRTSVPPGLTGFWQISARSNGNLTIQKLQDTLYIQHWSPWLDLWIILQTVPAVLMGKGAR